MIGYVVYLTTTGIIVQAGIGHLENTDIPGAAVANNVELPSSMGGNVRFYYVDGSTNPTSTRNGTITNSRITIQGTKR